MVFSRLEVSLELLQNDETRNKLKLDLRLYGFDLTLADLEKLLTVDEQPLVYSSSKSRNLNIEMVSAKKIYTNQRGTLKLVIWKNGKFSFYNCSAKPASMSMFSIAYDLKGSLIWDNLQEGVYVACTTVYWEHKLFIAEITDCTTRIEAEEWLNIYEDCRNKIDNNNYEEMQPLQSITLEGWLPLQKIKEHQTNINNMISHVLQLEATEKIDKNIALKTKITTSGNTISIEGLDGHKYKLEAPPSHVWTKEEFEAFVYRHRYGWKQYDQKRVQDDTLYPALMQILLRKNLEWVNLSIDAKPDVKVSIRTSTNKRGQDFTLSYLNDRRVAYDDLYNALLEYFIRGQALQNPAEEPEDVDEAEKQKMLQKKKQRDDGLVSSGITGYISDLEGEVPITIGFEKVGVNWQLVIGEKKIPIKGGVETIKSLERVLKGTAQGYEARHSTEELYKRLCKILSPEESIEIISAAKQMGKLLKALQVKGQAQ